MALNKNPKPKQERTQGDYVEHIACTSCPSSDAMAVYRHDDGSCDAYCWSCGHYEPNPYGDDHERAKNAKAKPIKDWTARLKEIAETKCEALADRGIDVATAKHFGVKLGYSESDGKTPIEHYYPVTQNGEITGYRVRIIKGKKFYAIGATKDADPFGYRQAQDSGGKTLFITEGQCDAMALFQALKHEAKGGKWAHLNPAVISINNGALSAAKELGRVHQFLSRFEKVVLVFDQDEPGQQSAEEVAKLLPAGKVFIAKLSEKDANKMLEKGKTKALKDAVIFKATSHKPDCVKSVADLMDDALKPVVWGRKYPYPTLTQITYGRRTGELCIYGAGSGCGKTENFKEMINEDLDDGRDVGVIFLEEPGARTLKTLAGKRVNKRFHIPDAGWTQQELREALELMDTENLLHIYDSFGVKSWAEIRQMIRWWVVAEGVKVVYLDHLTALTATATDERRALDEMLADMSGLVEELDFELHVISHLTRPGQGRKSHEEGGRVRQSDFRGSGSIAFWAHFIFALERDTQAETDAERNQVTFRCLKDRNTGMATGQTIPMYYDHATGRLMEGTLYEKDTEESDY